MQKRKKKDLDGIDRDILRVLCNRKSLSGRKIALAVGLTPSAIAPRLNNLKKKGILRIKSSNEVRIFKRNFGNKFKKINSPQSIFWELDLEEIK